MVDTGSEVNIIKVHLLSDEIDIDKHKTVLIKRISNKTCNTIGTVENAIYGKTSTFFIEPEDFDIPCEGILGVTYLTKNQATIDYEHETLKIGNTLANLKWNKNVNDEANKLHVIENKENFHNYAMHLPSDFSTQVESFNTNSFNNKSTWSLNTNFSVNSNVAGNFEKVNQENNNKNLKVRSNNFYEYENSILQQLPEFKSLFKN